MRRYTPAEAMQLLCSPKTIAFACDVVRNGAFAKASATTRDAFGLRVLDHVGSQEARRFWPAQLAALFALPIEQFKAAMNQEPVRRSQVPKPNGASREIGVPTFLRRCVSNALNDALTMTSGGELPGCARAYRRGKGDAVRESILDVAEAVYDGRLRFFAKLDIRSYFSEMPWPAIEQALSHYQYSEHFVALVMATVKCPVVRRERGRLVFEPTTKGAQMGLPESSVLANLVMYALDQELGVRNGRLVYLRYSDDLLVGAVERHEVVAAVRRIASWCREHAMQLKGVERNARLANLVYDVKKTKIPFLGAEVDHLGYIHMPERKLQQKLSELAYMEERVISDSVGGVSRFGNGGGVDAFDADDLRRSIDAFLNYWSALDPRCIPRVRMIMKRRFPSTSLPSDSEQGTVWIARLWGDQTDRVGGSGRTVQDPNVRSEGRPPRPTRMSPSATGGLAMAVGDECGTGVTPGCRTSSETCTSGPAPTSYVCEVAGEGGHASLTDQPLVSPACSGITEGSSRTMEKDASRSSAERRESTGSTSQSSSDPKRYTALNSKEFIGLAEGEEDWGSLSEPTDGASPPRSDLENSSTHVLVHAVSTWVGSERVVVVGRCDTRGGVCRRIRVRVVRKCRAESALVRQLTTEVRRCLPHAASRNSHQGPLVLGIAATWLPKALLQRKRRLRAPLLFGHVLDLHEAARGRDVVLVGGIGVPELLGDAINARIDRLAREAAFALLGGSVCGSSAHASHIALARLGDATKHRCRSPA